MESNKRFKKILSTLTFLAIQTVLIPVPTNNFYDTAIIHDFRGTNKFYTRNKKSKLNFQLSPYYQGASGCRNVNGVRDFEGNRLGTWNMLGLFFGREASQSLEGKEFKWSSEEITKETGYYKNYPNLVIAGAVLDGDEVSVLKKEDFGAQANTDSEVKVGNDGSNELSCDLTKEVNFKSSSPEGWMNVPIDFEKTGVRARINFDFMDGFGINIKTGFCNYKQNPSFVDTSVGTLTKNQELIGRYLTKPDKVRLVASDVKLDVNSFSKIGMEDTHVEVYVCPNFDLADEDGDLVVSLAPYLSFGVWLPTGLERSQDSAFSLPAGNDGFFGMTVEGSFNLDFPDTVQLSVGGGLAYFASRNLTNQRVPSSEYQYGIYPWKVNIKRRSGKTSYLNLSFKADDFSDNFDFFLDFVMSWHDRDDIKVSGAFADKFKPSKLEEDAKWQAQTIFAGLNYRIVPGLEVAFAFQSVVGGSRIYRTTTILGTMTLNF